MPFNPVPFLLSRAVIARQGVPTQDATRTAALLGLADLPMPQTLVLSMAVGRRQAPAPKPADAGAVASEPAAVVVPDVKGKSIAGAKDALAADFTVDISAGDDSGIKVVDQSPQPGAKARKGDTVKLRVAVETDDGTRAQ